MGFGMAEFGYLRGDGVELILCKRSAISYPLHNHISVFTLGFVLGGTIEFIVGKDAGLYHENDGFIIPPYTPHRINAKSRYTLLTLCVGSGMLAGPDFEGTVSGVAAFLQDAIHQPDIETRVTQALSGLPFLSQAVPARGETAVSGLKLQLERHPERRYSVNDMAETAFLSKYHLIRVFKREVGLTPHQFQIQNRIRKAQKLLEGSATVTEAALAAGFCDQSHFIRHFEKIVGLTPTDYKRACKAGTPLFK